MSSRPVTALPISETRNHVGATRLREAAPLLDRADFADASVFRPENMLREARRQKGLASVSCPTICVLDPDGDIVRYAARNLDGRPLAEWACYHTQMCVWEEAGQSFGVVGCAVGSSFSVLVAEQLFACGCGLLISVASAGQIAERGPPPYHVLIDQALRDEGTSYHYLPPSRAAHAEPALLALAAGAIEAEGLRAITGMSWTTDAPFRETAGSIATRGAEGAIVVEMEAAALYAFGAAQKRPVLCLAHVTNQLGCVEGDFEKGEHNGAAESLAMVRAIASAWRRRGNSCDAAADLVPTSSSGDREAATAASAGGRNGATFQPGAG